MCQAAPPPGGNPAARAPGTPVMGATGAPPLPGQTAPTIAPVQTSNAGVNAQQQSNPMLAAYLQSGNPNAAQIQDQRYAQYGNTPPAWTPTEARMTQPNNPGAVPSVAPGMTLTGGSPGMMTPEQQAASHQAALVAMQSPQWQNARPVEQVKPMISAPTPDMIPQNMIRPGMVSAGQFSTGGADPLQGANGGFTGRGVVTQPVAVNRGGVAPAIGQVPQTAQGNVTRALLGQRYRRSVS